MGQRRQRIVAVIVLLCAAGVGLVIVGRVEFGAWLIALTGGGGVYWFVSGRTNQYQRQITALLRPLSNRRRVIDEEEMHLVVELQRMKRLEPPAELASVHRKTVDCLQAILDGRKQWAMTDDLAAQAADAVARRREFDRLRDLTATDNAQSYADETLNVLSVFESKQDKIADDYAQRLAFAISGCENTRPPEKYARAHELVLQTLKCMATLLDEQRGYLRERDEDGVVGAARKLEANHLVMADAIARVNERRP